MTMAEMESMEGWKQEAFTWQLRINEVEERVAHLQRELEIVNFIIEQPEVKVAALELCLQSGKKKGGSKEVGCLIAAETEKFEHWNSLSRIRLRKAKSVLTEPVQVAASLKANIGQLQLLFNGAGEGDAAIKKARYEETLII
ncbi:hypothetical protein Y1Q_0024368 [Alligator mississippiensis]|uniref:Uncharacterized protein n=1 Tax=Alligator mississippiensis TaxID=8496 RepID=A0A151NJ39_ALLMI|nr:hypothetical protein Y1Q_0024368 [Alligator mississippiensis]